MSVKVIIMVLASLTFAYSKVDVTKYIKFYYPDSVIEIRNIILSKDQVKRASKLAKVKIRSRLVSFYLIKDKSGNIVAYAYIDTHRVRTKPETVLYIITRDGELEVAEVIAFLEPPEYKADERWLSIFKGKSLYKDKLILRRDIPNITGATLTARAITRSVRKVLALWQVVFGDKR